MIYTTRAVIMMMGGRFSNTVAKAIDEKKEGIGAGYGGVENEQEKILQGRRTRIIKG